MEKYYNGTYRGYALDLIEVKRSYYPKDMIFRGKLHKGYKVLRVEVYMKECFGLEVHIYDINHTVYGKHVINVHPYFIWAVNHQEYIKQSRDIIEDKLDIIVDELLAKRYI